MKKWIYVFLLMFIVCIGGIVYAFAAVNKEKANVGFSEKVVYGDKTATEGLTVVCKADYDKKLGWVSRYLTGDTPRVSSDFEFSASGDIQGDRVMEYEGVNIQSNWSYGVPRSEEDAEGLGIAYWELYNSTPAGESASKIVYYKDYYEFYPLNVYMNFPKNGEKNDWGVDSEDDAIPWYHGVPEVFEEIFKIPVLEEEVVQISVSKKNSSGISWGSGLVDGEEGDSFNFLTFGDFSENSAYFTFDAHTQKGEVVDTSHIKYGFGIYEMPYYMETDGTRHMKADEFRNAYPLDLDTEILDLQLNLQKTKLHLFTREGNLCIMTVIDVETMKQEQRIELCEAEGILRIFLYEDFMVVWFWNNQFVTISMSEDSYERCFSAKGEESQQLLYNPKENIVMDWDGRRLALCGAVMDPESHRQSCSFYIAVYDATGLLYYGEYTSSLSKGTFNNWEQYCELTGDIPLTISFGD